MPHLSELGITEEQIANARILDVPGDPQGSEELTVSNSVAKLADIPNTAMRAIVEVQVASIRWRYDGNEPDGSTGHIAASGDVLTLTGPRSIRAFRAFRNTASDATLFITYETAGVET